MIKNLSLKRNLQFFVAIILLTIAVLVPVSSKKAGAVPSMNVAMCKTYVSTDTSGKAWYKITAKYTNLTFDYVNMSLTARLYDGRTFTYTKSSALTSPSITSTQNFRSDSSATASISNASSGVTKSAPVIGNLVNCSSI